MTTIREVIEGEQVQGIDETIVYTVTTTPWGSLPTAPDAAAFERVNGKWLDRTAAIMTGVATKSGDVITLPPIAGLAEGHVYRIIVGFTIDDNEFSCKFDIKAEK